MKLGVSKTGEQIRRAQGAFNRLLIQNVNAVRKEQRIEDRGWEALRKLREEKKALRRSKNNRDMRMVMDADHEASTEMEEMQRRAEARVEREIAAEKAEALAREIERQNEATTSADVPVDGVTLIVTGTGTEENGRNEIDGAGRPWEYEAGLGLEAIERKRGEGGAWSRIWRVRELSGEWMARGWN